MHHAELIEAIGRTRMIPLSATPIGASLSIPVGVTPPAGWVVADGSSLDRTVYPQLTGAYGFPEVVVGGNLIDTASFGQADGVITPLGGKYFAKEGVETGQDYFMFVEGGGGSFSNFFTQGLPIDDPGATVLMICDDGGVPLNRAAVVRNSGGNIELWRTVEVEGQPAWKISPYSPTGFKLDNTANQVALSSSGSLISFLRTQTVPIPGDQGNIITQDLYTWEPFNVESTGPQKSATWAGVRSFNTVVSPTLVVGGMGSTKITFAQTEATWGGPYTLENNDNVQAIGLARDPDTPFTLGSLGLNVLPITTQHNSSLASDCVFSAVNLPNYWDMRLVAPNDPSDPVSLISATYNYDTETFPVLLMSVDGKTWAPINLGALAPGYSCAGAGILTASGLLLPVSSPVPAPGVTAILRVELDFGSVNSITLPNVPPAGGNQEIIYVGSPIPTSSESES